MPGYNNGVSSDNNNNKNNNTITTACFLVVVFCFEVSEPLPYTKGGHNVYIAKKKKSNDDKKGQKF